MFKRTPYTSFSLLGGRLPGIKSDFYSHCNVHPDRAAVLTNYFFMTRTPLLQNVNPFAMSTNIPSTSIKQILLIDDDPDEEQLMQDALQHIESSIKVIRVSEPEQLPYFILHLKPQLIFLDVNMPCKDGFYWLQKMQSRKDRVPVIVFSTSESGSTIRKAYECGAHLYVTKPFGFAAYIACLKKILAMDWHQTEQIRRQMQEDRHCPYNRPESLINTFYD
jgi:DNA-binding NarL/FixJ family response regulator